jgi:hypothetical protein
MGFLGFAALWLLAGTVLSFAYFLFLSCDWEDFFVGIIFTICFGLVFCPIIYYLGFCMSYREAEPADVSIRELVSIKDGDTVNGSFFLGCGNIGTNSYYIYYYRDGSDEHGKIFMRDKALVSISKICETNNVEPHLEIQNYKWVYPGWLGKEPNSAPGYYTYTFFVPEGTIIQQFKLE